MDAPQRRALEEERYCRWSSPLPHKFMLEGLVDIPEFCAAEEDENNQQGLLQLTYLASKEASIYTTTVYNAPSFISYEDRHSLVPPSIETRLPNSLLAQLKIFCISTGQGHLPEAKLTERYYVHHHDLSDKSSITSLSKDCVTIFVSGHQKGKDLCVGAYFTYLQDSKAYENEIYKLNLEKRRKFLPKLPKVSIQSWEVGSYNSLLPQQYHTEDHFILRTFIDPGLSSEDIGRVLSLEENPGSQKNLDLYFMFDIASYHAPCALIEEKDEGQSCRWLLHNISNLENSSAQLNEARTLERDRLQAVHERIEKWKADLSSPAYKVTNIKIAFRFFSINTAGKLDNPILKEALFPKIENHESLSCFNLSVSKMPILCRRFGESFAGLSISLREYIEKDIMNINGFFNMQTPIVKWIAMRNAISLECLDEPDKLAYLTEAKAEACYLLTLIKESNERKSKNKALIKAHIEEKLNRINEKIKEKRANYSDFTIAIEVFSNCFVYVRRVGSGDYGYAIGRTESEARRIAFAGAAAGCKYSPYSSLIQSIIQECLKHELTQPLLFTAEDLDECKRVALNCKQ
ncbi:MAG: hypothetical protein K0M45_03860 [Candidatus Paracaedibacteraceae bacterium]|nr:hypothetical protein [Candidatus Paracaedibacteraceae bacterium]